MKIAIGADSAGKPLLDVIATHLAGKADLEVHDLSQSGFFMPTSLRNSHRRSLMESINEVS